MSMNSSLVLSFTDSVIDREARTIKTSAFAADSPGGGEARRDEEREEEETSLSGSIIAESYVVLEPIGRGGMGRVYEVEHARTGRRLAMKVLTPKMATNREIVRRFIREGTAISKLHCANTVQVFDYGVSNGLAYIVMELVKGETLSKVLREGGPMASERAMRIVLDVCTALHEAHAKGIVHRDIKPDNVMIVENDRGEESAKVVDFGLAKVFFADGVDVVSSAGMVMGTPQYMSPEQIKGGAIDARSDVYSAGVLLYRMVTGHRPFSGNMTAILSGHLTKTPVPPHRRAPEAHIPETLSDIVMMALEKEPADRFQSVEALANALRSALDSGTLLRDVEREVALDEELHDDSGVSAYERNLGANDRRGTWVFVVALLMAVLAFAAFTVLARSR